MSVMANAARAALFGAVVSLVSIGASAADYTLSVNTALSQQDPLFKGLEEFKANVEKRSAGKMAVRLFPASQLGKDEDLLEQARAGAPVAVVVDGARQNYQRTGHNANGSFFLDPELIGGVDVVRGPTANIYGSGAIGGLVSFRTKDINDVVRPGERWGVDMTGSYGTNKDRGLGSIFGGVRVDPNVDVFGGAVYRTQANYKDGAGTTIGNTGNEIAAGLMKVTVRPADGHEIKFGGLFQDYQYSIGQFNRGPTTTRAEQALNQGSSVYASDAKNYMGTLNWRYSKPDDNLFDWNMSLYANRVDNDQTKTYHYSSSGAAYCGPGGTGNNISGCVGDKRGYVLNVFVEPAYRKRGLARELMRLAQAEFARRGIGYAILHTTAKGQPLYQDEGWAGTTEMAKAVPR